MKRLHLLAAIALIPLSFALGQNLFTAMEVQAQNTQCSDRSFGDSTNACANTRFVQNAVTPIVANVSNIASQINFNVSNAVFAPTQISLPSGKILIGTATNVANAQTMSGDCTLTNAGAISCFSAASSWRVVTATDTALTTDCGKTIGLGGNALYSSILPAVGGFPAGCEITVKNTDIYTGTGTGRGKQLSGYPTDLVAMLWPQQSLKVKIVNGSWVTTYDPQHWSIPQQVVLCVDTTGSNSNDGLAASGAGCFATPSGAINAILTQMDLNQNTPIIALACGQTHGVLSFGSQPTGTNLIQLSPNGNCTASMTATGSCISIADNAELDIRLNHFGASGNITFTCNTSNTASIGAIYLHNFTVVDLEGGPPLFNLGGANDNVFFCDGKGIATIANGISVKGTGNYAVNLDQTCKFSWSGNIAPTTPTSLTGIWRLNGASSLVLGNSVSSTGYTALGSSLLSGNSIFLRSGAATGNFTITSGSQLCDTMNPCNFAWTPSDASGAGLTFSGVSAAYNIVGNLIFASALVTYPATGSGATASIGGFPFNFSASNYGRAGCTGYSNAGGVDKLLPNGASSVALVINNANASILNSALTGATVIFNCTYPMQ